MALEINLVNLGTYPNDGSGDDLRTAFEKVNANFSSIADNVVLSIVNLGSGVPLYSSKLGNNFGFRSLKSANTKLSISYDSNEILLSVSPFLEKIEEDTSPKLGGDLDLNGFEITGQGSIDISGIIIADGFEGNLLGNVYGDVFGRLFGNVKGNVEGQVSDLSNHVLESLANVSTETPTLNSALVWDGNFWKPAAIVNKIIAGSNITVTPNAGTGEVTVNANLVSAPTNLTELTDVEITSPKEGQVLQYTGSTWTNTTPEFNSKNYDFGLLSGVRSAFDLLFQFTNIDFGSLTNPSNIPVDLGRLSDDLPTTYQLSASTLSVKEGSSVIINLSTNAVNGTVIPYQISGITSTDIGGTSLSGSFIVNNGAGSLTLPITIDTNLEAESIVLTLIGTTPLVSIEIAIEDFVLPDPIDGGSPNTVDVEFNADGGLPSTPSFILNIDGGVQQGAILGLPVVLDGGSPTSTPTVIFDGEMFNTLVTVVLDAGDITILP